MRIDSALVCIAVLYGVDAFLFDGRYVAALGSVIVEIYTHW
jgi:hypothetical protein